MTAYRIKWKLEGESVVHEAYDMQQAQESVEVAVERAAPPLKNYEAEVEHARFHYTRESTSTEDG